MNEKRTVIFLFILIGLISCLSFSAVKTGKKGGVAMNIKILSPAFQEGGMIPSKYAYDGENVSPPLEWSGLPESAKSVALICDDPDAPAGTWVHWVLYNIPSRIKSLKENISRAKVLEDGSMQGINDFRNIGYDGPCPPGGIHRYYFKIYALDIPLKMEPGATKNELIKAMNGHILAEGQIMGRYKKQ